MILPSLANKLSKILKVIGSKEILPKPPILITQGDPLTKTGISAITRIVANELGVKRCLVCLDSNIDPEHSQLADRHDTIYELRYSQLVSILNGDEEGDAISNTTKLMDAIEERIASMNEKRHSLGKDDVAGWYKNYALLQEVTKSSFKIISGEVTVAHSTDNINEFSVTSFYKVGLELGLIDDKVDMVYYTDGG